MGEKINLYIPSNRHVLCVGSTRSGKSYLAEQWLKQYTYVVKLDTKREVDERRADGKSPWDGLQEGEDFEVVETLEDLVDCETDKIIFAPSVEALEDMNVFEAFFKWIYDRGNTVLWCDETMSFTTSTTCPKYFKYLMIMGASKNIGVWCCTQRPTGIPQIISANISYILCFNLNLPQDRKKITDITGQPEFLNTPQQEHEDHRFYYYRLGDEKPILCRLS